ncbi:acyltransferase family protein [Evansella tamaricis]|uniref:Acyltransferase family protein n=1 Tax=Evansella tamaricis TaxID=2069301 RepID=A0ABS6JHW3_9BACI|nr:acyltransferase family protein [Evansella tamaricis]MBU9713226.1 acyltransferase family protein [Evansella tamaricis]
MNKVVAREFDLDWIRVLATLAVFLYHCLMFFNPFPWHVKNGLLDSGVLLFTSLFLGAWIMPLFFLVSGISTSLALEKRSISSFIQERLLRLGVPLLIGMFLLAPPQVYIERLQYGQFSDSFLNFIPSYFNGIYLDFGQSGNFAFHGLHLWYLLVLLVFSIAIVPLLRRLPRMVFSTKLSIFVVFPSLLFASGLISTIALGGWDLIFYLLIFIFSYYLFTMKEFKSVLKTTINYLFPISIVSTVGLITWYMIIPPASGSLLDIIFFFTRIVSCYTLLLSIIYFSKRYLSFSNTFLKYGSEASMPFYVLHQPVIVIYGFMIKDLSWSLLYKLPFLIVVSFATIMVMYHFIIRRVNILRFLFGMKQLVVLPKKKMVPAKTQGNLL